MLTTLSIRDVVLIERLDLTFARGLCALTGETGAGKSILLDALGLALGARADAGLVRAGAERAVVTAGFDLAADHPAFALLAEQDLPADEMIVRRIVTPDGRSRAFINDEPVSVGLLRQVGEALVEIQGQFDTRGLMDPASHRGLLDAFGAHDAALTAADMAWRDWRGALNAWERTRGESDAARRDEELLRSALEELDSLAPRVGEEAELAELRSTLVNRERIVEALNAAGAALGEDNRVAAAIGAAQRALERVVEMTGGLLDEPLAALERASIELAEATAGIEAASSRIETDGGRAEDVEERLFALRGVARKHGVDPDALPALHASLRERLEALEGGDLALDRLRAAADAARVRYREAAAVLSAARVKAGKRLDKAVTAELSPLKLDRAAFRTRIEELPETGWGPAGADRVAFEVATNPGAPHGPLARIASGGELARFMLALKVVLSRSGSADTLVFDEVDAGIGGAVAAAVGDRLARLAESVQVLVVTHSPQVAARAGRHWHVAKRVGATTVTDVEELDPLARREEIARMLSGARITDAARAAADSLLAAENA